MKQTHLLTILIACLLIGGRSFAQTDSTNTKMDSLFSFSVKLGTNITSLSGDSWENGFKPGIVGGVMVGVHKNKIGVSAEVLVSSASYKSTVIQSADSSAYLQVRATYISIPVMIEYQALRWLKLQAGPQYSNLISLKNVNFESFDTKVLFKSGVFSGVVGLEVKLPKNLLVGARFIADISNINNGALSPTTVDESWKNTTIQAYLGYKIR